MASRMKRAHTTHARKRLKWGSLPHLTVAWYRAIRVYVWGKIHSADRIFAIYDQRGTAPASPIVKS